MLQPVRARLLVIIFAALWVSALPMALATPIDADGPSGLSDNADFDDLIVSFTSPTAAVAPALVLVVIPSFVVTEAVVLSRTRPPSDGPRASVESRAPPLA
jgi:hypothetical protein